MQKLFICLSKNQNLDCLVRFITLLFLLFGSPLYAQYEELQPQGKWLLGIKGVVTGVRIIDNSFSSIPYAGAVFGASLVVQHAKKNRLHEWEVGYSGGSLQAMKQSAFDLTDRFATIDYVQLYNLRPSATSSIIYRAGGSLNVLYNTRKYGQLINRNSTHELAASLSGAVAVTCLFPNSLPGFSITGKLQAPLLSLVNQPVFGNEDAPGKHNRLLTVNEFLRLKSAVVLDKKLNGRSRFSLAYNWDYYQLHNDWQVKQARHQASISYSLIL